jgi:hypothetical protein
VFTVQGTKRFRDRVGRPMTDPPPPSTVLDVMNEFTLTAEHTISNRSFRFDRSPQAVGVARDHDRRTDLERRRLYAARCAAAGRCEGQAR